MRLSLSLDLRLTYPMGQGKAQSITPNFVIMADSTMAVLVESGALDCSPQPRRLQSSNPLSILQSSLSNVGLRTPFILTPQRYDFFWNCARNIANKSLYLSGLRLNNLGGQACIRHIAFKFLQFHLHLLESLTIFESVLGVSVCPSEHVKVLNQCN